MLGAAERVLEAMGAEMKPYERALHERTVAALRDRLGEETFSEMRSKGSDASVDDTIGSARVIASSPSLPE